MTENQSENPKKGATWEEARKEAALILGRTVTDLAAYPPEKVVAAAALVNQRTVDDLVRAVRLHANVTDEHNTRLIQHIHGMEAHTRGLNQH